MIQDAQRGADYELKAQGRVQFGVSTGLLQGAIGGGSMLTIITGTPGAGKTLYTVTKLVADLVGQTIQHEGAQVPRTVYTNINGLMLDHEKIDGGGLWEQDKDKKWKFVGERGGLRTWHEWAKPGSVIVFDEVQKFWTPRANGAPVPPDIQALETHRHMGVDFILITQGLMLTERNLAMLCNRHLHVRRVANLPFAVVYEWDHASKSLSYSKAVTNQKWWYDKKGYRLYKSAEVHTKQPRSVPKAAIVALLGIVGVGVLVPWTYKRFGERFGWIEAPKVSIEAKKPAVGGSTGEHGPVDKQPASGVAVVSEAGPKFSGCVASATRCACLDSAGTKVEREYNFCRTHTDGGGGPPMSLERLRIPAQELHEKQLAAAAAEDLEMIASAAARSQSLAASSAPPGVRVAGVVAR